MKAHTFKAIQFDSPEYEEKCLLRDAVLRKPLGMSLFDEDLEQERDQMHFGLFDESSELLACVIVAPQSTTAARLRQMAVSSDHHRKGYGSALLQWIEDHLYQKGFRDLHLHARATAIPFYQKNGYEEYGSSFTEVGIPHMAMRKRLLDCNTSLS